MVITFYSIPSHLYVLGVTTFLVSLGALLMFGLTQLLSVGGCA